MSRARLALVGVVSSVVLIGSVITSAPAQAAPTPSTLYFGGTSGSPTDCSSSTGIYSDSAHTTTVTSFSGTAGNITIQNDCLDYPVAYTTLTGSGTLTATRWGVGFSTFTSLSGSGTFTLYRCPLGNGSGSTTNCASPIPNNSLAGTATYSFSGGGGGGGGGGGAPGPSTATAPAEHVQQFGKPASGTCADVAPESLNWSGAASGGWSESWAQWMNGGNGGAVCTRTLVYRTSQGAWTVG